MCTMLQAVTLTDGGPGNPSALFSETSRVPVLDAKWYRWEKLALISAQHQVDLTIPEENMSKTFPCCENQQIRLHAHIHTHVHACTLREVKVHLLISQNYARL